MPTGAAGARRWGGLRIAFVAYSCILICWQSQRACTAGRLRQYLHASTIGMMLSGAACMCQPSFNARAVLPGNSPQTCRVVKGGFKVMVKAALAARRCM